MGARGPAPTPTPILRAAGSWRADERKNEPKPEKKRPTCPKWLDPAAKTAFRKLVKQLERLGVLGTCDRNALTRYCQMFSRWQKSEEFLMKHGEVYPIKDAKGKAIGFKAYPQVGIAATLADQLLRIEQQFGLTPAARTRLTVEDKPDNIDKPVGKDRFIKRAG